MGKPLRTQAHYKYSVTQSICSQVWRPNLESNATWAPGTSIQEINNNNNHNKYYFVIIWKIPTMYQAVLNSPNNSAKPQHNPALPNYAFIYFFIHECFCSTKIIDYLLYVW